jgi:SAM-dependent methyltransferase
MFDPESLKKIYKLFRWPEDLSKEGKERYERALEEFGKIISHRWIEEVLRRGRVRIVDICSGTGVGGIALAKRVVELGRDAELTFVDLREDALEKAVEFSRAAGIEAEALVADARELYKSGIEADIAILWGLSTPHFNPIDLVKLYGSVSTILRDGVFIVEEVDRFTMMTGYKDFLLERYDERGPVFTAHYDHDPLTGYTTRIILTKDGTHPMHVYFWDIASSIALSWIFFEDVDFMRRGAYSGYILAHKPRKFDLNIITGIPSVYAPRT